MKNARTLLINLDRGKDIVSVLVTTRHDSSYDHLFANIQQESEYGRIVVYQMEPGTILNLVLRTLQGEDPETFQDAGVKLEAAQIQTLRQLKFHCDIAGPDAVCFNFECSAGYSSSGFGTDLDEFHLELIAFCVKEFGCLCMFSDFSLKALIAKWDTKLLGPNPFSKVGEFGGTFTLAFDPEVFKKCSSAQLNTVGNLSQVKDGRGSCEVLAKSSTIAYTITSEAAALAKESKQSDQETDNKMHALMKPYEVEVLTVVESLSSTTATTKLILKAEKDKSRVLCQAVTVSGLAGHVMITYPPSKSSIERLEREQIEAEELELRIKAEARFAGLEVTEETLTDNVIVPARGRILASCGHWIELMKIDVNMTRLLETVKHEWGGETNIMYRRYKNWFIDFTCIGAAEFDQRVQTSAAAYVQSRPAAKFNHMLVHEKNLNSKFNK